MKTFSRIIIAFLVAFAVIILPILVYVEYQAEVKTEQSIYPLTTRVVEVDEEADLVTCEDFNGNLWKFEGCEDWQDGDICSLLMNSRGTEKIYDDEIVLAQYNGTFEGWN